MNSKNKHNRTFLLHGSRTPIGSMGRSLRDVPAEKLAGHVMVNAIRRAKIDANSVDHIIFGQAYQSPLAPNLARFAALRAGLPAGTPAKTVHRQCGTGMETINEGMMLIESGRSDVVLAGGVENMSDVPYIIPGSYRWHGLIPKYLKFVKFGPRPVPFAMAENGLMPLALLKDQQSLAMAATVQNLADAYGITREAADEYSMRSQTLATKAIESGRFDREIDPIEAGRKGYFSRDEHPRKTSLEKLAALPTVLGTRVNTAGNSSGINDAACAVVLASEKKVAELGVEPLAELVDFVCVGVTPEQMGIGPVEAIKTLLANNNLTIADIDLFELNEAFAVQYLTCEKLLGLDREKVNVNGGAIALGHPIAMSGARIILTLAHELKARGKRLGVAALCIGGGMGIATLIANPEAKA